ncbi:hypothetical protein FSARC_5914 [Fusarium sarcochroum]|uniref:Beta-glucuronidase C-terminal domain-containing protein n=1 Tax=Fusarium sarcochroum TaxID=1208366 RepID=A0A8H4TYE7_9HYPO|nr:hypothetical protein FSARC_5914 [Fusarium sarcochroum]
MTLLYLILAIGTAFGDASVISQRENGHTVKLLLPDSLSGLSIQHAPSFSSFSIEPAFWLDFVGTADEPNELFFKLISQMTERGGRPILRPGGIAMDSLIFDPEGDDLVRTMGPKGEVYRTTVGPGYYKSWSNFPEGVSFISTLNFGNNSLEIARVLAVASAKYQAERISFFELGNEPNHFPKSRWNYSTEAYVKQWKEWTSDIDEAVAAAIEKSSSDYAPIKWWASSATTDPSDLKIRPVDIIPEGVDSEDQVGGFSIHSCVYNSCTPEGAAEATIENLLKNTQIVTFANEEVRPSAEEARKHGKPWVIGEFNSVACAGKPNVTDTFTQALWMIDTQLTYAVLNATSVNQHQGATLVLQSNSQTNTPGFSTYSFVYPRDSEKHGEARALPSFLGVLFLTEVFAKPNGRIMRLTAPPSADPDRFATYAVYQGNKVDKLVLLNMKPYYPKSAKKSSYLTVDISAFVPHKQKFTDRPTFKRLTAPSVDEKDTNQVTWAGQSFKYGDARGKLKLERLGNNGILSIRVSEAILVDLGKESG